MKQLLTEITIKWRAFAVMRVERRKRLTSTALLKWKGLVSLRQSLQFKARESFSRLVLKQSFCTWRGAYLFALRTTRVSLRCRFLKWKELAKQGRAVKYFRSMQKKQSLKRKKLLHMSSLERKGNLRGRNAKRFTKKREKLVVRQVTDEFIVNVLLLGKVFAKWKAVTASRHKRATFLKRAVFVVWAKEAKTRKTLLTYRVPKDEVVPICRVFLLCVYTSIVTRDFLKGSDRISVLLNSAAQKILKLFCFVPNTVSRAVAKGNSQKALVIVCCAKVAEIFGLFENVLFRTGRQISVLVPNVKPEKDEVMMKQILILNQLAFASRKAQKLLTFFFVDCPRAEHQIRCTLFVKAVNIVFANFNTAGLREGPFEKCGAFTGVPNETTSLCKLSGSCEWVDLGL
jgi:hypothetical protein